MSELVGFRFSLLHLKSRAECFASQNRKNWKRQNCQASKNDENKEAFLGELIRLFFPSSIGKTFQRLRGNILEQLFYNNYQKAHNYKKQSRRTIPTGEYILVLWHHLAKTYWLSRPEKRNWSKVVKDAGRTTCAQTKMYVPIYTQKCTFHIAPKEGLLCAQKNLKICNVDDLNRVLKNLLKLVKA
jgi:hypothetical protein